MKLKLSIILLFIAGCVPIDPNAGQSFDGCQSSVECDDGIFCNGLETCNGQTGLCFAGNDPCPNTNCIESMDDCENSPSGIFTGNAFCDLTGSFNGDSSTESSTNQFTIIIDEFGNLINAGEVVESGQTWFTEIGDLVVAKTVINVTNTQNGLVIRFEVDIEFPCGGGNSCVWAFDGECDEPIFCSAGTDCADCGPFFLSGEGTTTLQNSNGVVNYIETWAAAQQSFIIINFSCNGELRQ